MIYYLRIPLKDFAKRTSLLSFAPKSFFKECCAKSYSLNERCTNLSVYISVFELNQN